MKFLIALIMLVASVTAFAQKRIVSIDAFDLNYTAGLMFSDKSGDHDEDSTTLRVNLNYAQVIAQYPQLMWRGEFHWNRYEDDENDELISAFGVAGGIIFNLQENDIKNSAFGGASIGLERMAIEQGRDDEDGFNWSLKFEGGKRWDMGSYSATNISYAPTIEIEIKRYGGGIRDEFYKRGTDIKLNFLKFDILF